MKSGLAAELGEEEEKKGELGSSVEPLREAEEEEEEVELARERGRCEAPFFFLEREEEKGVEEDERWGEMADFLEEVEEEEEEEEDDEEEDDDDEEGAFFLPFCAEEVEDADEDEEEAEDWREAREARSGAREEEEEEWREEEEREEREAEEREGPEREADPCLLRAESGLRVRGGGFLEWALRRMESTKWLCSGRCFSPSSARVRQSSSVFVSFACVNLRSASQ